MGSVTHSTVPPGAGEPVKVLFIGGAGRSGSTILHNILGQIDGFTAVGELRDVWQRGVLQDWTCGCDRPFHQCDFWQKVLDHAFGGVSDDRAEALRSATEQFRTPHLPQVVAGPLRARHLGRSAELRDALGRLYAAIRDVDGARVVVDSSKNPAFGYLAANSPGVDLRVLHFIRQPAAVAFSWSQRKAFEPGRMMARQPAARSAVQWATRNALTELFVARSRPLMRLRYEDFMEDPRATVARIVDWLGEGPADVPFLGSHEAVLKERPHSVFGNEVRFHHGPVELRLDERWQTQMSAADRRVVQGISWPLRRRYGYKRARLAPGGTVQ